VRVCACACVCVVLVYVCGCMSVSVFCAYFGVRVCCCLVCRWLHWKRHGTKGLAARVDRAFAYSRRLAHLVSRDHRFHLLLQPESCNICFYYLPPSIRARVTPDCVGEEEHEGGGGEGGGGRSGGEKSAGRDGSGRDEISTCVANLMRCVC